MLVLSQSRNLQSSDLPKSSSVIGAWCCPFLSKQLLKGQITCLFFPQLQSQPKYSAQLYFPFNNHVSPPRVNFLFGEGGSRKLRGEFSLDCSFYLVLESRDSWQRQFCSRRMHRDIFLIWLPSECMCMMCTCVCVCVFPQKVR